MDWNQLNKQTLADDLDDRIEVLVRRAADAQASQHPASEMVREAQSDLVQQCAVMIKALSEARDEALATPAYGWSAAAGSESSTLTNNQILQAYWNRAH